MCIQYANSSTLDNGCTSLRDRVHLLSSLDCSVCVCVYIHIYIYIYYLFISLGILFIFLFI